jgi:hypothetical protein
VQRLITQTALRQWLLKIPIWCNRTEKIDGIAAMQGFSF